MATDAEPGAPTTRRGAGGSSPGRCSLPAGFWYLAPARRPARPSSSSTASATAAPTAATRRRFVAGQLRTASSSAPIRSSRASRSPSPGRSCACSSRFPLAYFIATRAGQAQDAPDHPAGHPVLDELPGPDDRLADHPRAARRRRLPATVTGQDVDDPGHAGRRSSSGIVYNYLPLMVFPLYVTLERLDRTLARGVQGPRCGRWATFRQVTLPIVWPGLITGSILVFIPLMGEYVIPSILGRGKIFLIGNVLHARLPRRRGTGRPARPRRSS